MINGFGSSSLWFSYQKLFKSKICNCCVFKESPRHFDHSSTISSLDSKQNKFLTSVEKIIFVSSNLKSEWAKLLKLDQANLFYLPNAANETSLNNYFDSIQSNHTSVRKNLSLSPDSKILLCVGSIDNLQRTT